MIVGFRFFISQWKKNEQERERERKKNFSRYECQVCLCIEYILVWKTAHIYTYIDDVSSIIIMMMMVMQIRFKCNAKKKKNK